MHSERFCRKSITAPWLVILALVASPVLAETTFSLSAPGGDGQIVLSDVTLRYMVNGTSLSGKIINNTRHTISAVTVALTLFDRHQKPVTCRVDDPTRSADPRP